ncbi:MAG: DUF1963 domain-containing protein [Chloroflexia bacterium]
MEPAWLLNAVDADSVSRTETHFLGTTPYVPASEGWPRCEKCGRLLEFVCQINFAEFVGSGMFAEGGLFQFFYCWECFPISDKEIAEGAALRCRWYPQFDERAAEGTEQADYLVTDDMLLYSPTPMRVNLTPFLSFPDLFNSDHPLAHMELDLDEDAGEDAFDVERSLLPTRDYISQLGGYPVWIQSDETPVCPVCGKQAVSVAAIGSDDTQLLWGDSGYWYFFACKATSTCEGLAKPLMLSQSH